MPAIRFRSQMIIFYALIASSYAFAGSAADLPPVSSYFEQGSIDFIKGTTQDNPCSQIAKVAWSEKEGLENPSLKIDRMPIDDVNCPEAPNKRQYKLYKRYSECGKVVYTDSPHQSIDRAKLVLIDNRTGTCGDHPTKKSGSVVIRELLTKEQGVVVPDFFSIP